MRAQGFLTAVKQEVNRRHAADKWALDDVVLTTYPLFYDFGWWIDFAELERRIGPRTRAIVLTVEGYLCLVQLFIAGQKTIVRILVNYPQGNQKGNRHTGSQPHNVEHTVNLIVYQVTPRNF